MATDEERRAYREKLLSLNFGTVPGGYKDENSGSMFDRDQLLTQLGGADGEAVFSKERVEDKRSDFLRAQKEFLDADV
jgi:hypothetical protein